MKNVIKKAIENDYDIVQAAVGVSEEAHDEDKEYVYILNDDEDYHVLNIYQCVFGTNFVECLVGEGWKCGVCGEEPNMNPGYWEVERESFWCCPNTTILTPAEYHRAQMANKSLEEIKDYLRNLVNSQEGKG